ncbi:MAG: Uma2 family endonuclease [Coleofasciculaceae cyanobacterium SM2_1_6]|nr:Uma2 family endonuclease [Coleofasciculaceae cyanobacterium SM2_1_6]
MTAITVKHNLSFEEYLAYDDGTDDRYELFDGELILMTPPIGHHSLILLKLTEVFMTEIRRQNLPWVALQMFGVRTGLRRSRLPDLCVIPLEQVKELLDVAGVLESGALIVVEVVSPSSVTTDYRYKNAEYAAAGIPEYWIIDPRQNKISILQLVEGLYEEKIYQGDEVMRSPLLPELAIDPTQIFQI